MSELIKQELQKAIEFANENKICFLATAEGDQPTVRALAFWFADYSGFWFVTGTYQKFYQQLTLNPKTEVCFFRQEGSLSTMLRVRGKVNFCNDPEIKQKAIHDRPFLKDMGMNAESPELIIFRIEHGKATFWNNQAKDNMSQTIEF